MTNEINSALDDDMTTNDMDDAKYADMKSVHVSSWHSIQVAKPQMCSVLPWIIRGDDEGIRGFLQTWHVVIDVS